MDLLLTDKFHLVCDAFYRPINFGSLTSAINFLNSWNQPNISMMLFKNESDKAFVVRYTDNNEWVISSLCFNSVEVMVFHVLLTGG